MVTRRGISVSPARPTSLQTSARVKWSARRFYSPERLSAESSTQKCFTTTFVAFVIRKVLAKIVTLRHLSHIPSVPPMNFPVFSRVKRDMKGHCHRSVAEVQNASRWALKSNSVDKFQGGYKNWKTRSTLYLIYTSDLPADPNFITSRFADDGVVLSPGQRLKKKKIEKSDQAQIKKWLTKWTPLERFQVLSRYFHPEATKLR